jgi:hypothetical protein
MQRTFERKSLFLNVFEQGLVEMVDRRNFTYEDLTQLSDKELKKKLKNALSILEVNRQRGEETAVFEELYWLVQMERLKRLKGKNY